MPNTPIAAPHKTHALLRLDGITHGFFGRKGGVSSGQYHSLNAGFGSADNPEHIAKNRANIALALGTPPHTLISLSQIHSTKIITLGADFDPCQAAQIPPADGLVTRENNIAISALSADCGPVLFCDPEAQIIGACHAGWRGALAGVTGETIKAMCAIGAMRENIRAVLGPCISQPNYEVGPDFQHNLITENKDYAEFFMQKPVIGKKELRAHFDLKGFILAKLREDGLTQIAALPDCTYGQPKDYFSFRYNTHHGITDYGRNLSAIMRI